MIRIRFFGPGELIQNGFSGAQYHNLDESVVEIVAHTRRSPARYVYLSPPGSWVVPPVLCRLISVAWVVSPGFLGICGSSTLSACLWFSSAVPVTVLPSSTSFPLTEECISVHVSYRSETSGIAERAVRRVLCRPK